MKFPAWALWLGAGITAWLLWAATVDRARAEGALREQIRARELTIAALATQKARVDSIYTVDTLRLTRWRTRFDTVRVHVTVADTAKMREFVFIADSTVKACSVALETCEHRVAVRDSLLANQDTLIRALKQKPPFLSRLARPLTPFLLGLGAGLLLGR